MASASSTVGAAATASSSSTSGTQATASSERPDAHTQRYDRQLRLWASSGQASLESAHIAVLGATHLGACILKNLVLPGIGAFDLIDARSVDSADVGNNFFIEANVQASSSGKGKSRAVEVARNLAELNPQVRARGIVQEPSEWVSSTALDDYTLIIAVNQPNTILLPLADKAWSAKAGVGVPLMAVSGNGFLGDVHVQVKEAGIIETHPENTIDLRLTRPWPELEEYALGYDVDTKDSMEHSHIPFVVILLRQLSQWKKAHNNNLPQPSSDRKAFADSINSMRMPGNADEENVDEALGALGQHVWRPIANSLPLSSELLALFEDASCENVNAKSTNFWLLVRALREFVRRGDGLLPLPGSLPDFKALSDTYVEVQRLYRMKAQKDLQVLSDCLDNVLADVGLPAGAIGREELASFAKHASYIKLVRGRPFAAKLEKPDVDSIAMAFADPINPITIPVYLALQASQLFYESNGARYPGSSAAFSHNITARAQGADSSVDALACSPVSLAEDQLSLAAIARSMVAKMGISLEDEQLDSLDDACSEIARGGHADIPSTSAFLGGVAAQEAIKLVTRQYVPMDNTAVYDGIRQAIGVFKL